MLTNQKRLQSPTSILTYLQCPRKYYYKYIEKLPQKPNIHLITGRTAHTTIEAFHNTDITTINPEGFFEKLHQKIIEKFNQEWQENKKEILALGLSAEQQSQSYYNTITMIKQFYQHHTNKIIAYKHYQKLSLVEAWAKLRPKTETKLTSEKHSVMGVIDATHHIDGETTIIDYKTSKRNELDQNCVLQLAIYALLHKENYGRMPDKAGIHFLKTGEKLIPASQQLIKLAETTCQRIHQLTQEQTMTKYPKRVTGLCKYRTGQCDYYEVCMGKKDNSNCL